MALSAHSIISRTNFSLRSISRTTPACPPRSWVFQTRCPQSVHHSGVYLSRLLHYFCVTCLRLYLVGFAIDRYGHRGMAMMLAACFMLFVHLVFAFTTWSPFIPLVFLGLGYS